MDSERCLASGHLPPVPAKREEPTGGDTSDPCLAFCLHFIVIRNKDSIKIFNETSPFTLYVGVDTFHSIGVDTFHSVGVNAYGVKEVDTFHSMGIDTFPFISFSPCISFF